MLVWLYWSVNKCVINCTGRDNLIGNGLILSRVHVKKVDSEISQIVDMSLIALVARMLP
jgi:hypothetical protein